MSMGKPATTAVLAACLALAQPPGGSAAPAAQTAGAAPARTNASPSAFQNSAAAVLS